MFYSVKSKLLIIILLAEFLCPNQMSATDYHSKTCTVHTQLNNQKLRKSIAAAIISLMLAGTSAFIGSKAPNNDMIEMLCFFLTASSCCSFTLFGLNSLFMYVFSAD